MIKLNSALCTFGAALFSLVLSPAAAHAQVIYTDAGKINGQTENGISSWKGVPFAQPPVGDLRWRAPQPVNHWDGVREADEFASDCMQTPFAGDAAPLGTPPAEDCLYLNVWRPTGTTSQDRLPVMVWIYGGGFVNGGSSPDVYNGAELARQGVILVSFNYRIGRFGFFAHPELTAANEDNGLLGNYGIMDQLEALRWVQRNITAFGGDPNAVTIFGESAGGGSVSTLMASPMGRGLFDKAIIMSGGGRVLTGSLPLDSDTETSASDHGVEFAQWAGIDADSDTVLADLRALPAEKLSEGVVLMSQPEAPVSGMMLDGVIIPEPTNLTFEKGNIAPVAFMGGANTLEFGFPRPVEGEFFEGNFGPLAEEAKAAYSEVADNPQALAFTVAMDAMMVEPARYQVQSMQKAGQPAYHYRAGYVPESMREEWPGLPHANEIPFIFQTLDDRYPGDVTEKDRNMAKTMSAYFVNFAKNGDPNGEGLPQWSEYDDDAKTIMLFGADGAADDVDPWRARLDVTQKNAERMAE